MPQAKLTQRVKKKTTGSVRSIFVGREIEILSRLSEPLFLISDLA